MTWPFSRLTVRARLAGAFAGLILITGATVIAVIYLLLERNVDAKSRLLAVPGTAKPLTVITTKPTDVTMTGSDRVNVQKVISSDRYDTLHHLLMTSGVVLAVLVGVAALVGWWLSGRVLRPLHQITATAHRLSETNLHERIGLPGPSDELKDLADTFDAMLERLDQAFAGQRRFVANASHELRTPLAVQRTALQIGLADPVPDHVAKVREELLTVNRRSEHLIEGLLLLARSEDGLAEYAAVGLHTVVAEVTAQHTAAAKAAGVRLLVDTEPVHVRGDRVLLTHLVTNLVQNAVRYNHAGGTVEVRAGPSGLDVRNTGPEVPTDLIEELLEPFTRGPDVRASHREGLGLGLSIVRSITRAHGGTLTVRPAAQGGLEIGVRLPTLRDGE
jgi:signal transduction histidine kinase